MTDPDIYIIGSGAIGKVLAVFLQQEGKNVTLVRGSVDNRPEKENTITVYNQDDYEYKQTVTTTTFNNLNFINGIVLIAVKTFANADISNKLKDIRGYFSIVLLQNGLNIEQPFKSFDEVYRGVLLSTSQIIDENTITFKTVADSPVGIVYGDSHNQDMIVNEISTAYFGFRSEPNISKQIWNKTIVNCAFNSICPLLEVDNGIFHRNSDAAQLADIVIRECVTLAQKYDIELDRDEIKDKLMLISKRSDGQLISTYEDIRKKRKTEIDSLNLEVLRMADKIGTPELVSWTRILGKMIQLKSNIRITK